MSNKNGRKRSRRGNKFRCYHLFAGFAQGAVAPPPHPPTTSQGVALVVGDPSSSVGAASEKPITQPPVPLAPSGRNIVSNVYFPIEKLNKNLISTNDSPAISSSSSNSGSSSSASNSNNNNLRRRSQQSPTLNDLRPESDLINRPQQQHHQEELPPLPPVKRPSSSSSAAEREATNVTVQLNNHAYLTCKVINNDARLIIAGINNPRDAFCSTHAPTPLVCVGGWVKQKRQLISQEQQCAGD